MTIFLLALMALLLIAALERNHRRQAPRPPGPIGTYDRDDRDWARIQLDLLGLDNQPSTNTGRRNRPRQPDLSFPYGPPSPHPRSKMRRTGRAT